jgi:hypothetical protein
MRETAKYFVGHFGDACNRVIRSSGHRKKNLKAFLAGGRDLSLRFEVNYIETAECRLTLKVALLSLSSDLLLSSAICGRACNHLSG